MLLTLAVLLLQAAPAAPPAAPKPAPTDAELKQGAALIAKAVDAFGGAAAVDAVKALEMKGKGTRRIQQDDLPVTTLTRIYFPDRYYQELVLPMGTMKTVLSPSAAFLVAGEGSLPLPDAERQTLRKLLQRNLLAVLRARVEPGFTAAVTGKDTVNGTAVELVSVTRQSDALVLAIDPVTGRVLQSRFESGGGLAPTGQLVVTYSDYRKAGPITYPFSTVATMAGRPATSQTLETIAVNPPLDEALFAPPPPHAMFPGADDPAPPPNAPPPGAPPAAAPAPEPKPTPTPAPAPARPPKD